MIKFLAGVFCGMIAIYIQYLRRVTSIQARMITMQAQIIEAQKPPAKATRADWWESHMPETDDPHKLTEARLKWFRNLLLKFIHPYVDPTAYSILSHAVLTPLNEQLVDMELAAEEAERLKPLVIPPSKGTH